MKKFFISIFILTFSINLFAQTETNLQANDDELQSLLEARIKAVEEVSSATTNNSMTSVNVAGQVSTDSTWVEKTGSDNLLNGVDVGSYSKPAVVDIDNDGDYDVFVGSNTGIMWYFKNTGTKSSPVLTQQTSTSTYPLYNKDIGAEVNPTFVDIDGDGDFDLFNGISGGTLRYYKNTGTKSSPNFAEQTTSSTHPLYGKDFGSLAAPVFVDIDNDGDYDFFAGHSGGTIYYYENTGTKSAPVFTEKTGPSNPFNNVDVGNYSQPTFVDIDNDGDHDALIGASDGLLYFYKNEGSAATATFTAKTGANNPFNVIDAGIEAAPEFADMDGDGDVDMFVGHSQGTVKYFIQNLGDNTAPAAPTVVTTTPGNSSVLVTWKQNIEGDLSLYKIYGGESSNPTTVVTTSAKGTSSASFSAENGTTYYGHMTAVDTSGNESSKSAEAMVMPHNVDSTLSMSFDGTDDYVKVPHNDSLSFGTGDFAFSAWFRLDKVSGTQQIISKRASGSGNFEFQINTNKVVVYIGSDGWTGSTALSIDTWYHVLVTRSGSAVKAYLNGSEEISGSSSASVTSTVALTFGKDTAGDEYLDGLIEDVAIWNVGLSANAASAVYNSGTAIDLRNNNGNYAESANLKGYWRFSEGSGTLAHDFSGKGNHGTVSGAAWSSTVPTGTKVSTITGLTAEAAYRSVKLDWNSATNASEYHVYKSTDNSSFSKLADASTDSLDVTGLAAGTKYYFKVSGVNSDSEEGPSSASVSATPNRIFWVDDVNGSDNYNGKTKKAAFKTVHKILENNSSLLSGDTIKVMPSVVAGSPNGYYDFGNDRIETTHSRNFVMIGVAGADSTIFDAEDKNRHFWFDDGQTDSTVIKGISFKHGMADQSTYYGGGSIYIGNNTHIKFEDCVWDSNYVKNHYYGGAISIGYSSNTSFTGCTFQNNHAEQDDGTTYGGAVWIHSPGSKEQLNTAIVFKQTKFINNWVISQHSAYGGAIYSDRSTEFINCLFVKNYVIAGNGANANDGHEGVGGAIHSQPTWWNGNSYEPGTMKVINSTFHGNYTDVKTNNGNSWAGTIAYGRWNNSSTQTYLFNSIVSGSRTLRGGSDYNNNDVEDQIIGTGNNTPKLNTYASNVVGSTGRKWLGDYTYDTVPVYTDTLLEDYRLSDKSPLIGNGYAKWDDENLNGPTIDLLGLTRPYPSGSSPDMGAYENSLASSSSPLPVSGFVATRATNGAKLSWTKNKKSLSSDNDAENVQYQIYVDGLLKASTASLAYNLSGLTNGTTYKISVAALDTTTKLEGAQSITISVTPKYLGPWYVAAGSGAAVSDTSSSDDVGSTSNPLSHLKGAIEIAASGDTIILQQGTHSGSSDRGRDWGNTKSLVIMGDPALTADKIIIDAKGKDRHFTFDNNEDTTTQIIGLTLKNGYDTDYGGSIKINYASVKLKGVIFENNYSDANDYYAAGAVSAYNTSTIIDSCIFDGNYINSSEGRRGGAISVSWQNNVNEIMTVTRSTFKNNYVKAEKDAYGGAISTYYHAIRIENSVFHGNSVTSSIGSNTNYSAQGGAIYINNPSYWDSYASEYKSLNAYIINNTIVNNNLASASSTAWNGSGLSFSAYNPANIYVFNNIFRNNKNDYESAPYQNQLYFNLGEDANLYVDYNNVENFSTSFNSKDFGDYTLDVDPALTDSANGDFTLSDASLMLGAGASTYEGVAAPTVDYKGLARPNPAGSNPDLGAYENSLAKSPYPKPVTNLTAIGGSGQVTLSWEANETADSVSVYKVYKHTENFSVSSTYFVDSTTTTGYIIKNLNNTTRYYFRVTAVNGKGFEGTASNTVSLTPKFSGPIWWVDTNGNDNNNEGSETNSFASIKKALESAANGDTITIKKGIHKGSGNREIRFSDNDFNKSIVIRGEPGISADSVVIDAEDKSWHFMIDGANDNVIVFKDLTLKNGNLYQNTYDVMDGSSVSINNAKSVEFNNVIFRDNSSSGDVPFNAAASVRKGPASFIKCQFINNEHIDNSNHANGGAVYVSDWGNTGDIIFDQCIFDGNVNESSVTDNNKWGAANGSAIFWQSGKGKITNSLFVSNSQRSAQSSASGVIYVERVSVSDNNNNIIEGSLDIINNTFYNNRSNDGYGGDNSNNPVLWFSLMDGGTVTVFNNIIWNNYSNDLLNPKSLRDWGVDDGGEVKFGYNNIQGFEFINQNADRIMFENNFSFNPGFIDISKKDFRLSDKSALIGLGASTFNSKSAPSNDLLGNMRPSPSGSNPDLGAYENSLESSPYPQQVKHLHYTPASESVSLFWDANTDKDLEKYQIYMSTAKGFVPSKADSIGSTSDTTYLVTGLTNKLEYYFRVAAKDSSGYLGDYSEELMAIPQYKGPIWWVSDDAGLGGDGSSLSPMGSIREALDNAAPGDTIRILAGTYSGNDNVGLEINKDISIIGDGPEVTEISASNNNFHFRNIPHYEASNDSLKSYKVYFSGIKFTGSSVGFSGQAGETPWRGAIRVEDLESFVISNSIFEGNTGIGTGGAAVVAINSSATFDHVVFRNNRVETSQDAPGGIAGGAVAIQIHSQAAIGTATVNFNHCVFDNNELDVRNNDASGIGGALFIVGQVKTTISHTLFNQNHVRINANNSYGSGAAIYAAPMNIQEGYWDDYGIKIEQSTFTNNYINTQTNSSGSGGVVMVMNVPVTVINSVVAKNSSVGNNAGPLFELRAISDKAGNTFTNEFINNTIVDNKGTYAFLGANNVDESADNEFINNIFWDNDNPGFTSTTAEKTHVRHNIIQDNTSGEFLSEKNIIESPLFKNKAGGNYQLSKNSPAIDAGEPSKKIFVDHRGYYRTNTPDIGAFEAGASKYLLSLVDDIDNEDPPTFVKLNQQMTLTLNTKDLSGNLVGSGDSVRWNIFPSEKYVSIVESDSVINAGIATAIFRVSSLQKSKGFRFRVEAELSGDAFIASELYVIEEIVTGSPPPVLDLTITPDSWTSNPEFTLNWKTPIWDKQRDLLGLVMESNDGFNKQQDFYPFPTGDTLVTAKFEAPEAGEFELKVWLVDELGNENIDSSRVIKAYFDDVNPDPYVIHDPDSYQNTHYTSDRPRFEWAEAGDYPSGIKEWRIYTLKKPLSDDKLYGKYMFKDVTIDDGDVIVQDTISLNDGFYDWWLEAEDHAGNITYSDTGFFGVDLSPPNITHTNPLTQIDENTTSPAINATFSDGASGVMTGRLHYRRAGTSGGFVAQDLLAGPFNIPGSDIKAVGLEYYIDSEDSLGNYGKWPQDKAFQSVKVRTEGSVSTAGNLSLPGGVDSTNYIFFSIPFDVGNGIGAFKAVMDPANEGPDEFKYRLYAYNNGWQENPSSLTMGNGYFFIFDPDKYSDFLPIQFDFGQGVSTATDPPYKVNVTPGQWKFFGLPYNFNVPLSNIYTETGASLNDAGSIYTWSSSWTGAGSTLQPWRGYIFKSGGDTELNIDARGNMFGKMAESFDPDNTPMDASEWIVDIIASTGNTRDELNSVGVRHIAKDGYDRLDEFEPPTVPGNITLRIDNRDREISPDIYAKDIRKPNEHGHYWDLQVYTPTNGQRTYITFEGLGYVPQEYDIFIINKTNQQAKNLKWESTYRFANTGSEGYLKQDLRLVIGTKQFVEENNAGVNLYPDAFSLSQNYPNPFNPQTSIRLSLEEDANVDLIIYNLLGEEITRLAANEYRPSGYYNFIWNGRNAMGNKVSTGVYLYHAMVRDTNGKIVLNKTKKMIFLK